MNITLTEEEREELDNLRNFDLAKILLEREEPSSINPNMGTILVTQDGTSYELPGVYGYHETASAVTLAKHYHDKKYLNFGIAEIVNSGEVSITLNHMSIFVYRPLVLTEKQALYLNAFKEKIKILKEGYPEIGKYLEVICLIPTGRNDFSVLDFMQDETSLANYQNEDIDKLMMLSDELSKADTHIKR